MDQAVVRRLRELGHNISEELSPGKAPKKQTDAQEFLEERYTCVNRDGKNRLLCNKCSWSTTQHGWKRPLEHMCLVCPLKDCAAVCFLFYVKGISVYHNRNVSASCLNAFFLSGKTLFSRMYLRCFSHLPPMYLSRSLSIDACTI